MNKWRNMPVGDRRRIQVLIAFGLIGLYTPFYLLSSGRLFEAEKMLSRRKDRIEKRTVMHAVAGGPNIRMLEGRIAQVEERLKTVSASFDTMNAGFVPTDSNDAQQQLILELSALAERDGVQLLSVSRRGFSADGKAVAKTPADQVAGRPLIDVTAKASFGELFSFLQELKTLSFHVSVVNLKLYARDPKSERGAEKDNPSGDLHVQLLMSL